MTWEEYDKLCKEQIEKNNKLLTIFEADLIKSGLSPQTIKKHMFNTEFYINNYLLREEPTTDIKQGCDILLDIFFEYFFIHKCMWSTPGTIKSTAASLKKFYKCMLEYGFVEKYHYEELCETIKENMEEWQDECAKFNRF